ncbi:MAG TPA: amidohydrolase, partial [Nitrososphaerales archaeon]|nr:amidohydrolase [Nitrososphaerales archaeon]
MAESRSTLIENCIVSQLGSVSVLIEGDRIAEVYRGERGGNDELRRIDAGGCTLLPGMMDSHCHPFELGRMRRVVDLRGSASINTMKLRLDARVRTARPGEWIVGRGWDQEAFGEGRYPNRRDIDEVTKSNPAILSRVCGHVALLNSLAIKTLGLDSERGVGYEVDSTGELTGILKEVALSHAYQRMPEPALESTAADLAAADYEASRAGLTTLHCIVSLSNFRNELLAIASSADAGRLTTRLRVYVPPEAVSYLRESGLGGRLSGDHVRVKGVKIFADGSLGARTAALREPYSDDPDNDGILVHTDEELAGLVEDADDAGYQAMIHAIGDRAVEQAIGAIAKLGKSDKRHRIEHASLAPPDLRSKMKRHSIPAAVQPLFIVSDTWATARLGEERAEHLYPLKSMLREGIMVGGSSDAPVESISPVLGVWAAMARSRPGDGESLSVHEATGLYTGGSAYLGDDEKELGLLAPGSLADLVLLDTD